MQKNKKIFIFSFFIAAIGVISTVSAGEIVYESGGRRDPFSKGAALAGDGAVASGVSGYLEGIIYDPGKQSFAVFGGKTYKEGEKVGESVVVRIQKDSVMMRVNGEEKTLRIRD